MAKRDLDAASGGVETDVAASDEGKGPSAATKKFSRRFGLRALLGVPAALIGFDAFAQRADAAASPWLLTGNSIATNGTNYLGATNVAPIILKTKATSAASVTEKARLTPTGLFGVGTVNPTAQVHAVGGTIAVNGETSSTAAGAVGVQGRVTAASPASGAAGVSGVAANTGSAGVGVKGTHGGTGSGVSGVALGNGTGVLGNGGNAGVQGSGKNYGGIFLSSASGGYGVYASGDSTGLHGVGNYYGVYGAGDTGIYAEGDTYGLVSIGGTYGVSGTGDVGLYGQSNSGSGAGVEGHAPYRGVRGYGDNAGVYGNSAQVALWGDGVSWGLYGNATGTTGQNYGVYGLTASPAGYAGFFQGNTHVNGTLSKTAGSFKIDHPLDPDNKYLSHSFVESPDMMNVYNGNAVLGADGTAVITLPSYFEVLNRDLRYQLTAIGAPAQLYVKEKVKGNRFVIAGDRPGTEVSWQVTGIRQDDYARKHRIVVEEDKAAHERGRRLNPGANGRAIHVGPNREHTVAGAETAAAATIPAPPPLAPAPKAPPES